MEIYKARTFWLWPPFSAYFPIFIIPYILTRSQHHGWKAGPNHDRASNEFCRCDRFSVQLLCNLIYLSFFPHFHFPPSKTTSRQPTFHRDYFWWGFSEQQIDQLKRNMSSLRSYARFLLFFLPYFLRTWMSATIYFLQIAFKPATSSFVLIQFLQSF